LNKIVIFGVGLIGGSVALALKKKYPNLHIVGIGRQPEHLKAALDLGVINQASSDIAEALNHADVAIIAAPVAQTDSILASIKPHLQPQTIVTDVGSTKINVILSAKKILDEKFNQFIGGHPIAGAEKSGAAAAKADLFIDKNVVLTPTPETHAWVQDAVTKLWQDCGAKVTQMSAHQHDEIFANVSHLPHLLAFALVDDIANHPNAAELFSFAASGFRDFTRIAGSHPEMWRDISLANQSALLDALRRYQNTLSKLKASLENNDAEALKALFERASAARNAWASTQK
jgi:prephenate dehydrogenase